MRTIEEKQRFAERQAVWVQAHVGPVAAEILAYATKTGRGNPPAPRVYLRDVPEFSAIIADEALASLVAGVVAGAGTTHLASQIGDRVAEVTGRALDNSDQGIALGYLLLSILCKVTGCAEIVAKHVDKPNKVEGGVKVVVGYELVVTKQQFIEDAAMVGRVGMPTFQAAPARPWSSQEKGGVKGQRGGMMHGGAKQMRGISPEAAPGLYDALNAAQAASYRVNPVSAQVVREYDAAKAFAWLTTHYISRGMDPAKAAAKAKDDAGL